MGGVCEVLHISGSLLAGTFLFTFSHEDGGRFNAMVDTFTNLMLDTIPDLIIVLLLVVMIGGLLRIKDRRRATGPRF
jgi:ABC-type dipeptide/oligopeptide/nickel transport system permease subunit